MSPSRPLYLLYMGLFLIILPRELRTIHETILVHLYVPWCDMRRVLRVGSDVSECNTKTPKTPVNSVTIKKQLRDKKGELTFEATTSTKGDRVKTVYLSGVI